MKKISFLFSIALMAIMAITAVGQVQSFSPSGNAEPAVLADRFRNLEGMIDVTNRDLRSVAVSGSNLAKKDRPSPGDEPVFLLRANHDFIRRGETLEVDLVPMITTSRTFYATGQSLRPGDNGEYDGFPLAYVTPDNGNYGQIAGTVAAKPIKFFSRTFGQEDNLGRHTYNIVITDDAGRLVQQIIVDFYLVNAGRWGRLGYIQSATATGNSISMTGRFQTGLPIYWMTGSPDAAITIIGPDPRYAAYSYDGVSLWIIGMQGFTRTTAQDIMLWSPVMRYATVKPRALIVDVPPTN